MSERIQRSAKKLAENARMREETARDRAEANQDRGDPRLARVHRQSADRQAEVADAAEARLEADRRIEGDQLDE